MTHKGCIQGHKLADTFRKHAFVWQQGHIYLFLNVTKVTVTCPVTLQGQPKSGLFLIIVGFLALALAGGFTHRWKPVGWRRHEHFFQIPKDLRWTMVSHISCYHMNLYEILHISMCLDFSNFELSIFDDLFKVWYNRISVSHQMVVRGTGRDCPAMWWKTLWLEYREKWPWLTLKLPRIWDNKWSYLYHVITCIYMS